MSMTNIPIEFEINETVKSSLDIAVTQGDGDYDTIINTALERHLEVLAEEKRILDTRKEEVESGQWVDGETMLNWVKSLGTKNELPKPVTK